ncbi:porin [Phenylobacterium soli]|uniref:Porin n=1 Tax=Phenylobacterium soli TaxID=2170551 RepID=A0A328AJS8_9CAUL|nr:porin [Phenylobacterium soli]RAK54849.1 porin [Phenylobacterium soli]
MKTPARRVLPAAILASLFCSVAPAALAQAVTTASPKPSGISQERALALSARLDALEKRNEELEEQIADLKAQVAAGEGQIREQVAAQPTVSLNNGRPTFTSLDGNFKFALRSVVQFDAAHYDVSPLRTDNDLGSGTNFRRARLGFDATVYKDWNIALWGEFGGTGGESAVLNQAFVEYAGWRPFGLTEPLRLRVGAWATPTGLEDATSNTEGLFLERAAAAELVRGLAGGDGRTGFGAFARGERWYGSAVLTGKVVGTPSTAEYNQQSGYILRAAFSPLHGPDYDLHLGASLQGILEPADTAAGPAEANAVRLAERPEVRVSGARLVDTGAMAANGLQVLGLEAGASWKNLYAAGEWFQVDVSRTQVGAVRSPFDPSFSGWYLQGAWTLTGERHPWSSANGGFNGVKPAKPFSLEKRTWGAWELAGRYSVLDLNDKAGSAGAAAPLGGVRGGEQKITTLGLNWYPNNVVRFLLDYQWVDVRRLSAAGARLDSDVGVVSLRSQFAF